MACHACHNELVFFDISSCLMHSVPKRSHPSGELPSMSTTVSPFTWWWIFAHAMLADCMRFVLRGHRPKAMLVDCMHGEVHGHRPEECMQLFSGQVRVGSGRARYVGNSRSACIWGKARNAKDISLYKLVSALYSTCESTLQTSGSLDADVQATQTAKPKASTKIRKSFLERFSTATHKL